VRLLYAGLLTVGLLGVSRIAGLLREVAVSAVFGVSVQADLAVVALSLPDWLAV
jgi:putative peptidoglycan lipid II flippase